MTCCDAREEEGGRNGGRQGKEGRKYKPIRLKELTGTSSNDSLCLRSERPEHIRDLKDPLTWASTAQLLSSQNEMKSGPSPQCFNPISLFPQVIPTVVKSILFCCMLSKSYVPN